MSNPYEVLLYYKYARLDDPEAFAADHRLLCQRLGLRGRIVVATEGLNGTVSGTKSNCAKYREALDCDPIMAGIDWKLTRKKGMSFPSSL